MTVMDCWCNWRTPVTRQDVLTHQDPHSPTEKGIIALHWRSESTVPRNAPVAIVLPGFCECSTDYPPFCVTEPLVQAGWNVCVYVRRGYHSIILL